MSVQAISASLNVRAVTAMEKLVLIVLANYADPKMVCWPSQATLAHDTNMTERGVRKIMAALEEKGLIKRKARVAGKGRTSDLIMLTLPPEPRSGIETARSGTPRNHVPVPPEPRSGEPTIEPLIEPLAPKARFSEFDEEEKKRVAHMMKAFAKDLGERKCLPSR